MKIGKKVFMKGGAIFSLSMHTAYVKISHTIQNFLLIQGLAKALT